MHWPVRKERLVRNREYWIEKSEAHIARDERNDRKLLELGWTPRHFWEKEVLKDLQDCIEQIEELILSQIIDQAESMEMQEIDEL